MSLCTPTLKSAVPPLYVIMECCAWRGSAMVKTSITRDVIESRGLDSPSVPLSCNDSGQIVQCSRTRASVTKQYNAILTKWRNAVWLGQLLRAWRKVIAAYRRVYYRHSVAYLGGGACPAPLWCGGLTA